MYAVIVWVGHQIKMPAKKEEVVDDEEEKQTVYLLKLKYM